MKFSIFLLLNSLFSLQILTTEALANSIKISSAPTYINSFNQSSFEVKGTCSSEVSSTKIEVSISDGVNRFAKFTPCLKKHFSVSLNTRESVPGPLRQGTNNIQITTTLMGPSIRKTDRRIVSADLINPSIEITGAPEWIDGSNKEDYQIFGTCNDDNSGLLRDLKISVWDGRSTLEATTPCVQHTFKASLDLTEAKPRPLRNGKFNISISVSGRDQAGNSFTASTARSKDILRLSAPVKSDLKQGLLITELNQLSLNHPNLKDQTLCEIEKDFQTSSPLETEKITFNFIGSRAPTSVAQTKPAQSVEYLRFKFRPGDTVGKVLAQFGVKTLWSAGGGVEKTIALNPDVIFDAGNRVSDGTIVTLPITKLKISTRYSVNPTTHLVSFHEGSLARR